jgi:hypothetical protein
LKKVVLEILEAFDLTGSLRGAAERTRPLESR